MVVVWAAAAERVSKRRLQQVLNAVVVLQLVVVAQLIKLSFNM
ncbi:MULTISPECIES: hypothetical protein [Paenibacillus]|nr:MULTISPECIES: hypothetical protein [Paenibacillus]RPK28128.1 hypothetical protein EDO6_03651 [Paenibacillus xylanexedens]WFA85814.1 hypothetical protein OGI70_02440 [Paenibacillus amylolyticus]